MKQYILSKSAQQLRFFFLMICSIPLLGKAQTVPTGFSLSTVGSGWTAPVGTAFNNSGTKLFVWEKGGRVYVCNWNPSTQVYNKQTVAVLNISEEVGDWRDHGMLGFALDPNFDVNGLIYVLYVVDRHYLMNYGTGSYNPATNQYFAATIGRITRYKTITNGSNQLVADLATRTILLGETKATGIPILHESHGIGSLVFASDNTLLASSGDGASYTATDAGSLAVTYYAQALTDGIIRPAENVGSFRSQMVNSMNGKILRIDPATGNGISSNPFYSVAEPRSAASRVWALGLRNPFRFCIRPNTGSTNPATGDIGEIYIGDVGYTKYEELNIVKAPASNCGWPIFEGLTYLNDYRNAIKANLDEPNPLYGINGCTQQYFNFQDLIKQATADNITTVFNPCNSSVAITGGNSNRYFHRVPSLDWKHGTDSARVKIFTGNILGVAQIGSPQSGVTGTPFRGNCAVAGCWYTKTLFPVSYRNTYLGADYGGNYLRKLTIQQTDKVEKVDAFVSGLNGILSAVENPMDGSVFLVEIGASAVKRLTYGGNQAPVVKISANATYGIAPLPVNFTGNASFDPEGSGLTYSWDFGDGSPLDINANPSHTFTTPNSSPKKFVIKLTIRDNLNIASTDSIVVSANNTPPVVNITSPVKNSLYSVGPDTAYSLVAAVTDVQHIPSQLSYQWQTILRHNNHEHIEQIDTNRNTSSIITRVGCNGDTYYWLIKLTVTDAHGLKTIDSSKIFPNCSGASLPVLLTKFTVTVQAKTNVLNWTAASEDKMAFYRVERSYDGALFTGLGTIKATNNYRSHSYQWVDSINKQGYSFYRLKMVDIDGTFKYSPIVSVYNGKLMGDELRVSPNPFHNNFVIAARFRYPGRTVIRIIDGTGKLVAMQVEQARPGLNSFTIDELGDLPAGIYFVDVIQNNEVRKTKLVKTN